MVASAAAALKIDLSKVTAREMNAFFKAASGNDLESLATFFTRVVVACPYGDPGLAETYLDLPFFGGFQDVINAITEHAKKQLAQ